MYYQIICLAYYSPKTPTICLKILFIYFREMGRERNINVWLSLTVTPPGDLAHNAGMCPDWESNL